MNIDQAKARLAHFLSEPVPTITLQRHPDELEARAKWIRDFAFHADELLSSVAKDSAEHASCIVESDFNALIKNAVHDTSIAFELENEAADILEDMQERALERA